jgi:hypothetical protein
MRARHSGGAPSSLTAPSCTSPFASRFDQRSISEEVKRRIAIELNLPFKSARPANGIDPFNRFVRRRFDLESLFMHHAGRSCTIRRSETTQLGTHGGGSTLLTTKKSRGGGEALKTAPFGQLLWIN